MKSVVSRNCAEKLETLLRNQSARPCMRSRIFAKMKMSVNSEMARAIKLAAAMRAEDLKIASYAASVPPKRAEGGKLIANRENRKVRKTTTRPERTTLRARSLPWTSMIMSLIVKMSGERKKGPGGGWPNGGRQ